MGEGVPKNRLENTTRRNTPIRAARFLPPFAAVLLVLVAFAPGAFAGSPAAPEIVVAGAPSSDLCGKTIIEDLELDHDLACTGMGITVGADGVDIELNGHTIRGPSRGPPLRGITIAGRADVEIEGPGTVENFRTGILILNSRHVEIEKVIVARNGHALFGDGDGIRIVGSTDVEVEKCTILGNGNDGIEVVSSTDVELEKNRIAENGNGIRLAAVGNEIEKNKITANACGIRGSTSGNELEKNKFDHNTADYCA